MSRRTTGSIICGTVLLACLCAVAQTPDPFNVSGAAYEMQDPAGQPAPVSGAYIKGSIAPRCYPRHLGNPPPLFTDTTTLESALTGSDGKFALTFDTTRNYDITAFKAGYFPQKVCADTHDAPAADISFDLLDSSSDTTTTLDIFVSSNSSPIESSYVYLYNGWGCIKCHGARYTSDETMYDGTTNEQGKSTFTNLPLLPYVDYLYDIYVLNPLTGTYDSRNGKIRLNKFKNNRLDVDFSTSKSTGSARQTNTAIRMDAQPNPTKGSVRISFSASIRPSRINVYSVSGKHIAHLKYASPGMLTWNADRLANGVYIIKARVSGKEYSKRIVLLR